LTKNVNQIKTKIFLQKQLIFIHKTLHNQGFDKLNAASRRGLCPLAILVKRVP